MKITFIRPSIHGGRAADAMEPLAFAILAGLTPPGDELTFYDERLEPVPLDEPTDLVALTIETYTARRGYQIATHYRRQGIPVVVGGYHPTFLPEEALHYADSVVLG
nr:B12-binding domain-containing radical SAM protein [Ardenticatenales bacterium]